MARTLRDVDLCELVKACAEAGVREFKHGALVISFGPKQEEIKHEVAFPEEMDDNEVDEGDSLEIRERQHAELLIEDPEAYEKLALMGEES